MVGRSASRLSSATRHCCNDSAANRAHRRRSVALGSSLFVRRIGGLGGPVDCGTMDQPRLGGDVEDQTDGGPDLRACSQAHVAADLLDPPGRYPSYVAALGS